MTTKERDTLDLTTTELVDAGFTPEEAEAWNRATWAADEQRQRDIQDGYVGRHDRQVEQEEIQAAIRDGRL